MTGCTVVENPRPPAAPSAPEPPPATAPPPSPSAPSASSPAPPSSAPPPAPAHAPVAAIPAAARCAVPGNVQPFGARRSSALFLGYSLDGASEQVLIGAPPSSTVAVYAAEGTEVKGSTPLAQGAIAWSFGGKRQAVVVGNRVQLRDGSEAGRDLAGATIEEGQERTGSMSHDGRFLVLASRAMVFDLVDGKQLELPPPPIAGGSDASYRIDATGRLVFASNSRMSYVGVLTYEPSFRVAWTAVSAGAQVSRDGSVVLSVPHQPFAQDWVGTFELRGAVSARLPLSLKAGEPFAAALCPGGNLVAVAAHGELAFYTADSGRQVWKKPLTQLTSRGAPGAFATRAAPELMAFNPQGTVLRMRSGDGDLFVRLSP